MTTSCGRSSRGRRRDRVGRRWCAGSATICRAGNRSAKSHRPLAATGEVRWLIHATTSRFAAFLRRALRRHGKTAPAYGVLVTLDATRTTRFRSGLLTYDVQTFDLVTSVRK